MIRNPILPGFNPDPSFIRAEGRWYIATSTFEWYPGVQIHVSDDLANWELACRPLDRASQLDLRGNPDSCGVWAPCLSYADGQFWLVYTDVKRLDGSFKDAHNYIVTAPAIEGPWSDPIYVNSSGFDPSLFHDEDGRKWVLNMQWSHQGGSVGGQPRHVKGHPAFDGILCQEWDPAQGLLGEAVNIYPGSDLGLTEAPHLLKRKGWYYLTVAEGGTGYDHAVTMARARNIMGPYETHPHTHVLTARTAPESPLQRVGHGQIAHDDDGVPWHSFLCGRPLPGPHCPLGRETGIARCFWGEDDWLYGEHGQVPPRDIGQVPDRKPKARRRIFVENSLPPEFQWLRTPYPDRIFTLTGKALRLTGRESIGSWFEQSLVARRQEHFHYSAETTLTEFTPTTYQQAAGLVTYYNRHKFHFLAVTFDADLGRCLSIQSCPGDWENARLIFPAQPLALQDGPIDLAVRTDGAVQQFYLRQGEGWQPFGPELDAAVLSDEGGRGEHASFTGNFVGMAAYDITGQGRTADFSRFDYLPGET